MGLIEFHQLLKNKWNNQLEICLPAVTGFVLFSSAFLSFSGLVEYKIFALYFVLICFGFIAELYRKKENPVINWAVFTLGQIYIALPFALLNVIAFINGKYNSILLLAFFACIWIFDSGAYLVGVSIGKHRLFERISPKKSWEGFFGGLVFAFVCAYIFSKYNTDLNTIQWMGFALVIVVFATFGDLSESLLKRTIGIKDSGKFFPGHVGIQDRFDSILFASIAVSIYLKLIF
jgi:phosphatidate cytidylyltransferase